MLPCGRQEDCARRRPCRLPYRVPFTAWLGRTRRSPVCDQPESSQLRFQFHDVRPGKYWRVLPFVWRIGKQAIRPPTAANKRKQRTLVQPRQADLRDRACSATNDDAGVPRQRHE